MARNDPRNRARLSPLTVTLFEVSSRRLSLPNAARIAAYRERYAMKICLVRINFHGGEKHRYRIATCESIICRAFKTPPFSAISVRSESEIFFPNLFPRQMTLGRNTVKSSVVPHAAIALLSEGRRHFAKRSSRRHFAGFQRSERSSSDLSSTREPHAARFLPRSQETTSYRIRTANGATVAVDRIPNELIESLVVAIARL